MSAQQKKTSILCQMAMISRSKLPFSIDRKCSSFAGCMEQSHRGQGALLAHFDATRCCGVIRISTNLHRAQKRMLPCQIKKGPILMFSSVKPAVFFWLNKWQSCFSCFYHLSISFEPGIGFGRPPYGFELIWVTLHKARHSCAANQISACDFFLACSFILFCIPFNSFRSDLDHIFWFNVLFHVPFISSYVLFFICVTSFHVPHIVASFLFMLYFRVFIVRYFFFRSPLFRPHVVLHLSFLPMFLSFSFNSFSFHFFPCTFTSLHSEFVGQPLPRSLKLNFGVSFGSRCRGFEHITLLFAIYRIAVSTQVV